VPSAAPGGRETGIAWAWRGLSLASHAGVIAAAVAVAGPQPAAVIEAYTVEIVFSDSVAGGHGEGTDMAPAPAAARSAREADLADPSTADRATAGLRAPDPTVPGISLSAVVPVPDPAPPAEVAGPPDGAPSPGAAGASPAYRSRGDTPLVSPQAADPADAEPPTALDPPNVLPAAGPTPPVAPAGGSRPGARVRLPGPPPRKPRVPQRPPEIAETSPAPAQPSADAAGKAPPAKPAPANPPADTPVGTSPPQLETFVASAAPGAAPAAPVARAPGVSGRETAGGAKRTVSAAGYAAGHLGNVPPVYPYRARRKEIEGRVVLRVRVLPGGTARSVEVLSSSGHAILDRAALKAVRAWRFVPAKRAGVPVAGAIDVPITFRLTD
jgi:protein TonB